MPRARRRRTSTALVVLATALVVAAAIVAYVQRTVLNADQFANRATATLRDPSVRTLAGERITDRLVLANEADLLAVRPLISAAIGGLSDPDERAAAAAVSDSFLGDLRTWGWVMAGAGAVIAAAVASVVRPIGIEAALRRAWRVVVTEPEATWLRVVRAVALIAAGVLVIAQPSIVQIAATLAGVFLVYKGVETILRLIHQPPAEGAPPTASGSRASAGPPCPGSPCCWSRSPSPA